MRTEPGRFAQHVEALDLQRLSGRASRATGQEVAEALRRDERSLADLAVLLSPAGPDQAAGILDAAREETERRFGRGIELFAPLYVSNACLSTCTYCGFAKGLPIERKTLTPDEVMAEAEVLTSRGLRNVLLVSGEHRVKVSPDYLVECVSRLAASVPAVSIETQTWADDTYQRLRAVGLAGVVHYQETYDRRRYAQVHVAGWKRNFVRRLNAMELAAESGVQRLGFGALLGLARDWRADVLAVVAHARFMLRQWPQLETTVALPRIRPCAAEFQPLADLTDQEYLLAVAAVRLCLLEAGIVLSTRESAELRDQLVRVGITHMSADASTEPGGYSAPGTSGEQFSISDHRTVPDVRAALVAGGHEPR